MRRSATSPTLVHAPTAVESSVDSTLFADLAGSYSSESSYSSSTSTPAASSRSSVSPSFSFTDISHMPPKTTGSEQKRARPSSSSSFSSLSLSIDSQPPPASSSSSYSSSCATPSINLPRNSISSPIADSMSTNSTSKTTTRTTTVPAEPSTTACTSTDTSTLAIQPRQQSRASHTKHTDVKTPPSASTPFTSSTSGASTSKTSQSTVLTAPTVPTVAPPVRSLQFINRHAPVVPRPRPEPSSSAYIQSPSARQQQARKQKREADKIKRSSNCFIMYRTKMHPWIVKKYGNLNNKEISRLAGRYWKAEPETVKNIYRQQALEEKLKHASLYPSYKYTPSRSDNAATQAGSSAAPTTMTTVKISPPSSESVERTPNGNINDKVQKFENDISVSTPINDRVEVDPESKPSIAPVTVTVPREQGRIKRKRDGLLADITSSSARPPPPKKFHVTETALHDFIGDTIPGPPTDKKVKAPRHKQASAAIPSNSTRTLAEGRPFKVTRSPGTFPTTVAYEFTAVSPTIQGNDNSNNPGPEKSDTHQIDPRSTTSFSEELHWDSETMSASLMYDPSLFMNEPYILDQMNPNWSTATVSHRSSGVAMPFSTSLMGLQMPTPSSWPTPPPLQPSWSTTPFPTPVMEVDSSLYPTSAANSVTMNHMVASLSISSPGSSSDIVPQGSVSGLPIAPMGMESPLSAAIIIKPGQLSWSPGPIDAASSSMPSPAAFSTSYMGYYPLSGSGSITMVSDMMPTTSAVTSIAPSVERTTEVIASAEYTSQWGLTSHQSHLQQQQRQQQTTMLSAQSWLPFSSPVAYAFTRDTNISGPRSISPISPRSSLFQPQVVESSSGNTCHPQPHRHRQPHHVSFSTNGSPLVDPPLNAHKTYQWMVPEENPSFDCNPDHCELRVNITDGSPINLRGDNIHHHPHGSNLFEAGSTFGATASDPMRSRVTIDHVQEQQRYNNSSITAATSVMVADKQHSIGAQYLVEIQRGDCHGESEEELSRSIEFYERLVQQQKARLTLRRQLKRKL